MITEQGFMLHVVVAIRIMGFIAADPLVNEFTILIAHLIIAYDLLMNTIQTIDLWFVGSSTYLLAFELLFLACHQDSLEFLFCSFNRSIFHRDRLRSPVFLHFLTASTKMDCYLVY